MLAATNRPVVGSTARAVVLADVMKVMDPSCRATDPVGADAGANARVPVGDPTHTQWLSHNCRAHSM